MIEDDDTCSITLAEMRERAKREMAKARARAHLAVDKQFDSLAEEQEREFQLLVQQLDGVPVQ